MAKKILLVEDEEELAFIVKKRLEANGYEVACVYDGLEALKAVHNGNPDMVILDLMLPKMDGYKVCSLLKKDMRYGAIPIILFSTRAQESDKQMGQEAGADAYIPKPFDLPVLLAKIKELLKEA